MKWNIFFVPGRSVLIKPVSPWLYHVKDYILRDRGVATKGIGMHSCPLPSVEWVNLKKIQERKGMGWQREKIAPSIAWQGLRHYSSIITIFLINHNNNPPPPSPSWYKCPFDCLTIGLRHCSLIITTYQDSAKANLIWLPFLHRLSLSNNKFSRPFSWEFPGWKAIICQLFRAERTSGIAWFSDLPFPSAFRLKICW